MIEYYRECFKENAPEEISKLLEGKNEIEIKTLKTNATVEILKKNPNIFLFLSGYLTFGDFEDYSKNNLRFPNNEVKETLSENIFNALNLTLKFTIDEFETFLMKTTEFFDLCEKSKGEKKPKQEKISSEIKEMKSTLMRFFVESIKDYQSKTKKDFRKNEKNLTNVFNLYLDRLKFKNWVCAYQPEILNIKEDKNKIRKPDFLFSNISEETEIILEFIRGRGRGILKKHVDRKYHNNTKLQTKKVIEMYYQFDEFDKIVGFGVKLFRKNMENITLVFEGEY